MSSQDDRIIGDDLFITNLRSAEVLGRGSGPNHVPRDVRRAMNELPSAQLTGISWETMSFNQIEDLSVVTIDRSLAGLPEGADFSRTLYDPRLGATSAQAKCGTCQSGVAACPGHMGKIPLYQEEINPLFMKPLIAVLSSVCPNCGQIPAVPSLLEAHLKSFSWDNQLSGIKSYVAKAQCKRPNCDQAKVMQIDSESSAESGVIKYKTESGLTTLDSGTLRRLLDLVEANPATLELMGFGKGQKPSNFLLRVVPVHSTRVLSTFHFVGGKYPKSPLVGAYDTIVRAVDAMKGKLETAETLALRSEIRKKLKEIISKSSTPDAGPNSIPSIATRLSGKEGFFRSHVLGKRTGNVGRVVLGPADSRLAFGQIGIPEVVLRELVSEETVAPDTVEIVRKWLVDGTIKEYISRTGPNANVSVTVNAKSIRYIPTPAPGDSYIRRMLTGDYVLINRQPTLHAHSTLAVQAVSVPGQTILLHSMYSKPMGSDFDGDEGNLHAPTGPAVMTELMGHGFAPRRIMDTEDGSPVFGLAHNAIHAVYLLTDDRTVIPRDVWQQYIFGVGFKKDLSEMSELLEGPDSFMNRGIFADSLDDLPQRHAKHGVLMGITKAKLKPGELPGVYGFDTYTGKSLVSAILPTDFFYERTYQLGDVDGPAFYNHVVIKDGVLVSGRLTKSDVGAAKNGIIRQLHDQYDYHVVVDFINNAQRLLEQYYEIRGASISLANCYNPTEEDKRYAEDIYQRMEEQIRKLGPERENELEEMRRKEAVINIMEGAYNSIQARAIEKMDPDNPLVTLILSGGKGNTRNMVQAGFSVGPQYLLGTLLPAKRGRFAPSQREGEVVAPGFCLESYGEGLSVASSFLAQRSARQQQTDGVINTPEAGDMRRQLSTAIRDIISHPDGSVRDVDGKLILPLYNQDGIAADAVTSSLVMGQKTAGFINIQDVCRRVSRSALKLMKIRQLRKEMAEATDMLIRTNLMFELVELEKDLSEAELEALKPLD